MEEKKTLKGFTLVELIIVLAIFSVILALVMSFIDPVSNLMKNTSIRERTAAYSDNISEYIDNSLHYAKYLYVYEGGEIFAYGDTHTPAVVDASLDADALERAEVAQAAKDIVEKNLGGAVRRNKNNFITGLVRVMKFDNSSEGQIYEWVCEFTSGQTANPDEPVIDSVSAKRAVLNPEHFENYNYHYSIGYYDYNVVPGSASAGSNGSSGKYEKWLVPKTNDSGSTIAVGMDNFPINIIAYGNKEADSRYAVVNGSETVAVFKSPTHMSTVSMALINAKNASRSDVVQFYHYDENDKIKAISGVPFSMGTFNEDNSPVITVTNPGSTDETTSYSFDKTSFYIAYVLPYEIYDTEIQL